MMPHSNQLQLLLFLGTKINYICVFQHFTSITMTFKFLCTCGGPILNCIRVEANAGLMQVLGIAKTQTKMFYCKLDSYSHTSRHGSGPSRAHIPTGVRIHTKLCLYCCGLK